MSKGHGGASPWRRRRVTRPAAALTTTTASSEVAVRTYAFQGFEPMALLDGVDDVAVVECDQVGQPRLAVDREGALVWEGQFDAWGGEIAETGEIEVEIRFPGQVADGESGLRYNRFRYYDAESRTYTQVDPVGLVGGLQPCNYVLDPTFWADPYGLTKDTPADIARSWQGKGDYPGIDNWENTALKPGQIVYAGEPGVSGFFMTPHAVRDTGGDASELFSGLQVKPNPKHGDRVTVTGYEVVRETPAATSRAVANDIHGKGGRKQYFVPGWETDLRRRDDLVVPLHNPRPPTGKCP